MTGPASDAHGFEELIGRPAEQFGGCWGLARLVLSRLGAAVPEDPAAAAAQRVGLGTTVPLSRATRRGDVLVIESGDEQHVGVCLDEFRFIHAAGGGRGVRVESIEVYHRAGLIVDIVRPRALSEHGSG